LKIGDTFADRLRSTDPKVRASAVPVRKAALRKDGEPIIVTPVGRVLASDEGPRRLALGKRSGIFPASGPDRMITVPEAFDPGLVVLTLSR
jgi:hypothetical protein